MKYLGLLLATLMAFCCHHAKAQTQPVNTGLGQCIDFIIYGSPTLTAQVNTSGYAFAYASGAYFDRINRVIYIQSFVCNPNAPDYQGIYFRVSQVAHEMSHTFDQGFPLGTREDFIEKACTNEGSAVINNAVARAEIMGTSEGFVDIGLAAANPGALIALINAGGADLAKRVGDLFCDTNITSTSGVNYKVHWGNVYDAMSNGGE